MTGINALTTEDTEDTEEIQEQEISKWTSSSVQGAWYFGLARYFWNRQLESFRIPDPAQEPVMSDVPK
jgi:hypothetical protein